MSIAPDATAQKQVHNRRVFYVPGFDPFHARRYRELYRTEGADQAKISGYEITQSRKADGSAYGWHVAAKIDDKSVTADIDVLIWADIVRKSMKAGILGTYAQLANTAWIYISTGVLFRLTRLRKGPVIAALYPVVMLLGQLILAGLIAFGAGYLLAIITPWISGLGLLAGYAILTWFRKKDGKFYAYYLLHDFAFCARWRGANPAAIEDRLAAFTDQIAEALNSSTDEVLIVGHSSGAHLAVSALADLIRQGRVPKAGPRLAFLSLGHAVPMVSFLPNAHRLRADLNYLCQRDELFWLDVTAPGDGCCFALCDPVSVSGVAPDEGKKWPIMISAAFTKSLSPKRWNELKRRYFRLHFQYLCAFDAPKDYDYFKITAGPISLADRFQGRNSSKSRIDKSVSGFTGMTP